MKPFQPKLVATGLAHELLPPTTPWQATDIKQALKEAGFTPRVHRTFCLDDVKETEALRTSEVEEAEQLELTEAQRRQCVALGVKNPPDIFVSYIGDLTYGCVYTYVIGHL